MKGFKKYMKNIWGNYIEFKKATEIWKKLSSQTKNHLLNQK